MVLFTQGRDKGKGWMSKFPFFSGRDGGKRKEWEGCTKPSCQERDCVWGECRYKRERTIYTIYKTRVCERERGYWS